MAKDFKVDQISIEKLIITGSLLTVYSSSAASDSGGTIDPSIFDRASIGVDTLVFVSGSIGSRNTSSRGISTFAGDVVASGSLISLTGLSGSLTKLHDGLTSYITSSGSISVTSQSNGQVTISAAAIASSAPDAVASYQHAASGSGYSSWRVANCVTNDLMALRAVTTDALYAMPFIGAGATIDSLGLYCSGVVGTSVLLGVYNNSSSLDLYPTTLIDDVLLSASPAGSFSGSVLVPTTAGNLYWAVVQANAAVTLTSIDVTAVSSLLGYSSNFSSTYGYSHMKAAWTWDVGNVLPANFPPTGALQAVAAGPPAVFMHISG